MPLPAGQSSSQPLGSKELTLFRKVVKHYEHKQYKSGLRCVKPILNNPQYSEHGETLAMKGLLLNCLGKREEAQECVKQGLRADLRSHVCWHVYGLIQRSEKKYDEAMKAYKQALKLDSDNMQILRDLSVLQIQVRDLDGYLHTRYKLLMLRPQQRIAWIGYATAYHLVKDYDMALKIVNEICNNYRPSDFDFEQSELILYQNMILRESGQLELALQKLEENSTHIIDKVKYMEIRGNLLLQSGEVEKAEMVYWTLIERNPENATYYEAIEKCRGLKEDDLNERYAIYQKALALKPRASLPKNIPLRFFRGKQFEELIVPYLISNLRKGIPSLFKYLLPLYIDNEKVEFLDKTLLAFAKSLETDGKESGTLDENHSMLDTPTTCVWLYYLLAQHYDKLGQLNPAYIKIGPELAVAYIDRAILHTPTLIELFMMKAKIFKHKGDEIKAARFMEEAQMLDTADRFVNCKCAKYLLRGGKIKEAEQICSKFTREGVSASINLNEMQCMWYQTECARAFERAGNFGEALKKCHEIERHFVGIVEDQYDFHSYCIRKMTLTSYVELLRLEDVLRRHKFYFNAAMIAIRIYLRMYDRPEDFTSVKENGELNMSAAELKKFQKKQRKAKAKLAYLEETTKQKQQTGKKPDIDVDGFAPEPLDPEKLIKVSDPLEEASKFVQPLLQLDYKEIEAYIQGFEVYYRKKKVLLMLQCINKGAKIDNSNPYLLVAKGKYLHYYSNLELTGTVGELVAELTEMLFPETKSPHELNEQFKMKYLNSFPHRLAAAELSIFLDENSVDSAKAYLLKSLEEDRLNGLTLKTVAEFFTAVPLGKYGHWSFDEIAQLKKLCRDLFKDALLFADDVPLAENTTCDINKQNSDEDCMMDRMKAVTLNC